MRENDGAPNPWMTHYLAHRRPWQVVLWSAFIILHTLLNAQVAWMDIQRSGSSSTWTDAFIWEASSHLVWAALLPLIAALLERWPITWRTLKHSLPRHALASVAVSVLHVLGMVGLRKLVYAWQGRIYDFGDWPSQLLYEGLKDVRSYAFLITLFMLSDFLLLRWQGEASEVDQLRRAKSEPEDPPEPSPSALPERFLVRKLGQEFLIATADVTWVQAMGNYVNLHREGRDYPLRATLAVMEQRLAPQFQRVHRSYLAQVAAIERIEPTDAGDARLHMRGGASIPCSRTHLEALRRRLA